MSHSKHTTRKASGFDTHSASGDDATQTLTNAERRVLDLLVEAHNQFTTLPTQHPHHGFEWMLHMNGLQRLIMARPVSRAEGWSRNESEETDGSTHYV